MIRYPTMRCCIALFFMLGLPFGLMAQERIPEKLIFSQENQDLLGRLSFARKQIAEENWRKGIDTYQRLLQDHGDQLVPIETAQEAQGSMYRSRQIRWLCHDDLANLPSPARKIYLQRINSIARNWLEKAREAKSDEALEKIVREAFSSSSADEALALLGDRAFERGDFDLALRWWNRIASLPSSVNTKNPNQLTHPEPSLDLAGIRAKMILAMIFAWDQFTAEKELEAFGRLHGDAKGTIAGKLRTYSAMLKEWLQSSPADFQNQDSWPTFGGNSQRNARVRSFSDVLPLTQSPTWQVPLPTSEPTKEREFLMKSRQELARELAYYPVVAENLVFVSHGHGILAVSLQDGKKKFDISAEKGNEEVNSSPEGQTDKRLRRHLVSVSQGKIFATLGSQRPLSNQKEKLAQPSDLYCYDYRNLADGQPQMVWRFAPKKGNDDDAAFLSAPLVHENRVYITQGRLSGFRLRHYLVCLDALSGEQLWESLLFEIPQATIEDDYPVVSEPCLTLAEENIIVTSHRSAILAVNKTTGILSWTCRYQSRGPITIEGRPSDREIGPCIYSGGRIYVAPMDAEKLFCLDANSGLLLWQRDDRRIVHLLGVHKGRLLYSHAQGLHALALNGGEDESNSSSNIASWDQPNIGILPSFGRGLLLGDWYLWPTQDPRFPLRVVHITDGQQEHGDLVFPPQLFEEFVPGNCVYANGYLLVAGTTKLSCYAMSDAARKENPPSAPPLRLLIGKGNIGASNRIVERQDEVVGPAVSKSPALPSVGKLQRIWQKPWGRILPCENCETNVLYCWNPPFLRKISSEGDLFWECAVPYAPDRIAVMDGCLLAAGASGISAMSLDRGKIFWGYVAQFSDVPKDFKTLEPDPYSLTMDLTLSGFCQQLTHFCVGERHWYTVHPKSGQLTSLGWIPGVRLHPLKVSQELERQYLQTRKIWNLPDGGTLAIDSNGSIVLSQGGPHSNTRSYQPRLPTTLTGESAQLFVVKDVVLAFLPRNYGYDLERIDPSTGNNLWPAEARICFGRVSDGQLVVDDSSTYYVSGDRLFARDLRSGALLWVQDLPHSTTGWQVRLAKNSLVLIPQGEPAPRLISTAMGSFYFSVPLRTYANLAFRIRCHGVRNGQLISETDLAVTPDSVGIQSFPNMLVVSSGGQLWGLASENETGKNSISP